jgi:hypothetical protein
VIEQNSILEEQRKEQIRQQQRIAEERKHKMEIEKQKELQMKKQRLAEKEHHSVDVRNQMEVRESSRINTIKQKRNEKDSVMAKT